MFRELFGKWIKKWFRSDQSKSLGESRRDRSALNGNSWQQRFGQDHHDRRMQYNLWYFLLALVILTVVQSLWVGSRQMAQLDYSRFRAALENGQVERVAVSDNYIEGTLKEPLEENGPTRFYTTRVEPDFAKDLADYDVTFDGEVKSRFLANLLSWLIPIGLLIGFWYFMIRKMGQGGGMSQLMQIGKSRAKIWMERRTGTGFDDVAGVDEAKHELEETVSFLRDPDHYGRLGARQPKGILLVGPPGTGKTLLARAVAGEAEVPFFQISGSEFVEMFVGVGAARVRDLFKQAREQAPCIIFVDELDALGRARSGGGGGAPGAGGHDEKEQTLNQLLNEMDGFDPRTGIVILAATNQPQVLDLALLRAGRFDRQVLVDRPDKKGRLAILEVHARDVKLAPELELDQVAALTTGFSGADLANLVNEAAIHATRRDAPAVAQEDFTAAIERIVAGLEKKSRILNNEERKVVAHHEMGHAIVAWLLPGVDKVHKVSIVPRSVGALGFTMQRPTEDRFLMSAEELHNKMAVLFGGRAAESLLFEHVTTGAADDLSKATQIARSMVGQYGMHDRLGQVAYEQERRSHLEQMMGASARHHSDQTARDIDQAVREILDDAYLRASTILEANSQLLKDSATALLEQETLEREDLNCLLKRAQLPLNLAA